MPYGVFLPETHGSGLRACASFSPAKTRDGRTSNRCKIASGSWGFRRLDGWLDLVILANPLQHGKPLGHRSAILPRLLGAGIRAGPVVVSPGQDRIDASEA